MFSLAPTYDLMAPATVFIKGEYFTPEVILDAENGLISIKGRCTPVHANLFYIPINNWAHKYIHDPHNPTVVHIYIDLLNSSSKPYLAELIKILAEVMYIGCKLEVTWFVEKGDEDSIEIAEYISDITNVMIMVESG